MKPEPGVQYLGPGDCTLGKDTLHTCAPLHLGVETGTYHSWAGKLVTGRHTLVIVWSRGQEYPFLGIEITDSHLILQGSCGCNVTTFNRVIYDKYLFYNL